MSATAAPEQRRNEQRRNEQHLNGQPLNEARPVGLLLREWRERRRLSQLELSSQADVSTRHLSFLETGRSRPTSEMIHRLTEQLDVPLRERNQLLLAGGFAPTYPQNDLDAPQLASVRAALRQVLAGHDPYPAVVVNRWWQLLEGNEAIGQLTAGCAPHLLAPPVNVLRLSLHPDGMAPRIHNLGQWRAHLLQRLRHQAQTTGDPKLNDLLAELAAYPGDESPAPTAVARPLESAVSSAGPDVVVPLRIQVGDNLLSFLSVTAVFGTPLDVTVAELAIESFYPADELTAQILRHPAAT